jgi:hypothetical protein
MVAASACNEECFSMRALTLALSIAGLSLPALLVGMSGPGQAQGPVFKLEVCSGWARPVLLSLVHRAAPNDQKFVVKGWFALERQGQCAGGDLPRGNFATFAFSINNDKVDKIWGGQGDQAVPICVDVSKAFERVLTDNYQCKEENNEVLVPFQLRRVTNEPGVKITFR